MAEEQAVEAVPPPPSKPLNQSIAVGLHEAALDSPTFRATAAHFAEQIDAVERWLIGYVTSTSKLAHDIMALEETINTYLSRTIPSTTDGIIENDYTFLALKRVGDGQREYWMQMLSSMKKMDGVVCEPIRTFLGADLRNFKEVRRNLEHSQRTYDSMLSRYVSQSKTKEPSALREDAFSVYEHRRAYIQASMDYCQLAPQLRFTMDKLLVKVCTEIWKEMKNSREAATNATRWSQEMERIRGWAKEMELSEGIFKRELHLTRRELSSATFEESKPSREIEDYSTSTVPFLGSRGPVSMQPKDENAPVISEKQGWLFLRLVTGKPVRHTWVRRWYYCRDGVFGWLTPGPQGVLQGDEIGVLLCNAKPAAGEDRRFCFEIKTKSLNMMLQAESQKELTEWLEVFEVIKKKVFESSMGRESQALLGGTDPAFSISPPVLPEFSAKNLDAHLIEETGLSPDRAATLQVGGSEGSPVPRQSFDPNGSLGRRSITALGRDLAREEDESRRDHAARIISKLDLHRKAAFGAGGESTSGGSSPAAGGIASLISASHNLLPGAVNPMLAFGNAKQGAQQMLPSVETHPGTLAPFTLAKPPVTTILSRSAVMAAGQHGTIITGEKLPTSVVANYWGSSIWGAINAPSQPMLPRLDEDDPIGVVVTDTAQTPLSRTARERQANDTFPSNYPPELKAQHAQFRLLFPSVPLDEKLVLVFRAAWSSSTERDSRSQPLSGDGRIYVTPENMYFYGLHMGLVTAYSISLDFITEVSAAPGRDCDFIFLQLGQDTNDTGYTRITIKVFLGDLHLLHTRLNLLIDNLQAEEPMNTEDIINTLINIERDGYNKPSPSLDSWEDLSAHTPTEGVPGSNRFSSRLQPSASPRLQGNRSPHMSPPKLHLPSHPVVYEPGGMELASERNFEISAKACFHVLFGDKSFVFPKLYFERRADQIAQGPWVLVDQGKMRREFHFQVDYVDMLGRSKTATVTDYQTIDVFNEHVTYVVTHTKTSWHLPHSQLFKVIAKTVITHVAKSKCKLAIYLKVEWSKSPAFSKNLVQRQALRDAESDAEEQAELATDQVRKLGARSRTNRAIQVYGHVGQQTQVVVFSPASTEPTKKQAIKPRTLTAMLLETARSLAESAITSLMMWAFAGVKKLFNVVTAHKLLLLLLGLSAFTNLYFTSNETSTWWKERRAASFMRNLGIGPNPTMSKAIYIADLTEASGTASQQVSFPQNSTCFATFKDIIDATDMDAPWQEAGAGLTAPSTRSIASRLRRTRQRLGSYRHDLLVAMRIVNSMEVEVLQSEWENWLVNEKSLCDDLEAMLQSDEGKGSKKVESTETAQKLLGSMPKRRKKELLQWRDQHCGSCKKDYQAAMGERKLGGLAG